MNLYFSNLNFTIKKVVYHNNIFVAIPYRCYIGNVLQTSLSIRYSTDGKNWSKVYTNDASHATDPVNLSNGRISYANNRWYIPVNGASSFLYSANGTSWLKGNNNPGVIQPKFTSVVYDGTKYIAGSSNGLFRSTDGINFTNTNVVDDFINHVVYKNSVFIAIGDKDIYWSSNGVDWEGCGIAIKYVTAFDALDYNNGVWVLGSKTGLWYSTI